MEEFLVIIGNSNRLLGDRICRVLDVKPINTTIKKFSNGEICVKIHENIRNKNVVIIQTGSKSADGKYTVNDIVMETQVIIDACNRSSAKSICVVYANFPYARQDKKCRARAPIASAMMCNMLNMSGVTRLVTMDLHSEQIQGMFNGPFDNLYGINSFCNVMKHWLPFSYKDDEWMIVSPDAGAVMRAQEMANRMRVQMAIMSKRRNYSKTSTVESTVLIGPDIKGMNVIIVDDMADTCGTVVKATEELKKRGAKDIYIVVTHGILSGPAIDRINNCDSITKIVVSDSIDQTVNFDKVKKGKLQTFSVAQTFAQAIKAIHTPGGSISALFNDS